MHRNTLFPWEHKLMKFLWESLLCIFYGGDISPGGGAVAHTAMLSCDGNSGDIYVNNLHAWLAFQHETLEIGLACIIKH